MSISRAALEVQERDATGVSEPRFKFGENWSRFASRIDESQLEAAIGSLRLMLDVTELKGKTFLDIGSGSGLFSLAAHKLGAVVYSFDYDLQSVSCTASVKQRYCSEDSDWQITQGSVLDERFMNSLGEFDVVYSWGVLHHTGNMEAAFARVVGAVKIGGQLFIAIYNDQGWISRYWSLVKRVYNRSKVYQALMIILHAPYLLLGRWVAHRLKRTSTPRGMSLWHDMLDWLGGYPFEVATPERIISIFRDQGFELVKLTTCGGKHGCNQFVFRRLSR